MKQRVLVIGGGYGGIAVAGKLDDAADVVLVEPREKFVHTVAALRGLVDPEWAERMFLPYDNLLRRGTVRQERVVALDTTSARLSGGDTLEADVVVLASGSSYPFPAKVQVDGTRAAQAEFTRVREELNVAGSVLLVGAGPVGIELAGEIRNRWADKTITLIDRDRQLLPGALPDALRVELRRQLRQQLITVLSGQSLLGLPPSSPGSRAPFTVRTDTGLDVCADIWFRCHGVDPISDYLTGSLQETRTPHGAVRVTPQLQVTGHDRLFAVGDVTDVSEPKMAKRAELHAAVVSANVRSILAGEPMTASYDPAPEGLSLPLGPTGGVSYRADVGLLGPVQTAALKGADLRIEAYRDALGLRTTSTTARRSVSG